MIAANNGGQGVAPQKESANKGRVLIIKEKSWREPKVVTPKARSKEPSFQGRKEGTGRDR